MHALTEVNKETIRQHADKILSSPYFSSSPRQQRFFDYLVRHTLNNDTDQLKGYTIGIEVFDRDVDFDPSVDAIVRVEATRIRNKLREYYEDIGKQDDVRIHFRKGSYILDFSSALPFQDNQNALADIKAANQSASATVAESSKPSVVVLPFISISADNSRDYFAEGMTDSLISLLAKLSGLFVISRQSSFAYKDTLKTASEIAAELGVKYLVEGSVQHADNRVRVAAHLVKAEDDTHIWSERYDRKLADIFELQDELTQHIANALQVQLTGDEDKIFGFKATNTIEAHDLLLRAISIFLKYSKQTTEQAIALLREVIKLDENYAAAHAWLARALSFMWAMYWDRSDAILNSAHSHAQQALNLAPDSPYANSIMGWVSMWQMDAEASIFYSKKAVSLDPNNAEALLFLSMTLSSAGFGKEALTHIEKAMQFTPTSAPFYEYALGNCFYVLKDYKKALATYERGIKLNPNFIPNHYGQTFTFAHLGMHKEIAEKLAAFKELTDFIQFHTLSKITIWTNRELHQAEEKMRKKVFGQE